MSKQQTTIKSIRQNWSKVYRCGYCDLDYIMRGTEPNYYNSGVYGWNCDVYCDFKRDIAITTGYRNMAGKRIPSELLEKHRKIAKHICENYWDKPYEEYTEALEKNRENFFDALEKV